MKSRKDRYEDQQPSVVVCLSVHHLSMELGGSEPAVDGSQTQSSLVVCSV